MEDNASDHIRELLGIVFPEFHLSRFVIKETEEEYQINLTKCDEQKLHSQRYSPRISIYKDGRMHIERLTSCTPLTGAEMIHKYIRLARELGLQFITLDDESEIYFPRSSYGKERCAVYLPILRILQKGKSWYESLGFDSPTSDAERAENERVRHMPFGMFIQRLMEKEIHAERERILRRHELNNNNALRNREIANAEKKKSMLEGLQETFPEIGADTPVYEAIQKMIDHVNKEKNPCESTSFRMLQHVINTCIVSKEPLIQYRKKKLTMKLNS